MDIIYLLTRLASTAIHIGKHRVSSDPRSQANDGAVSTMMGDRMGILRAVVPFCSSLLSHTRLRAYMNYIDPIPRKTVKYIA